MTTEILKDLAEIIERDEHLYLLERPVATPHALFPSALEEHSQKLLELAKAKEKQGGLIVLEYTPPAEKSVQLLLLLLHSRLRQQNKRVRLLRALTGSTIDGLGEEVSEEPLYLLIHQAPRIANFVEFLEHQPLGMRWVVIATGLDRAWQRLLPQLRLSYTPYTLNGLRPPQELEREIEQLLNEELSRQTQAPDAVQEVYITVALSDAFGVPLPLSLLAKALGKDEDAIAELVNTAKGLLYWVEREKPPALLVSTKGEEVAARLLQKELQMQEAGVLEGYRRILQVVDHQDREERHTALKLLHAMLFEAGRRHWTKHLIAQCPNLEGVWKACSVPELVGWGKLFEELQLFEKSEQVFRYGLGQNPSNVYLLHAYARMLGRWAEARPQLQTELHRRSTELFEEALRLPGQRGNVWVWQSWADMEAKVGDPSKADGLFNRAHKEDPKSVYVLVAYADFLRKHHRYAAAEEQLHKALRITEKERHQDLQKKVYALQILGEIARQQGRYSEAAQRFAEALQIAPKNVPTLHARAMLYKERGWLARALNDINEALRVDEENPYTLHALAEIYAEQRHYEEAQRCFEQVFELQPSNFKALIAYATMQRKRGGFQQADELLRRAEDLAPQNPYLWHARGELELARGNSKRAQELFEYVIERLDPSNIAAWASLGQLEAAHNIEGAHDYFRRALGIAERQEFIDRIKTLNTWARAEAEHGDHERAKALYEEAIKLDGENTYTLTAYAQLLHKLGQTKEAQRLEAHLKELQKNQNP